MLSVPLRDKRGFAAKETIVKSGGPKENPTTDWNAAGLLAPLLTGEIRGAIGATFPAETCSRNRLDQIALPVLIRTLTSAK